jgi:hypothetical protein
MSHALCPLLLAGPTRYSRRLGPIKRANNRSVLSRLSRLTGRSTLAERFLRPVSSGPSPMASGRSRTTRFERCAESWSLYPVGGPLHGGQSPLDPAVQAPPREQRRQDYRRDTAPSAALLRDSTRRQKSFVKRISLVASRARSAWQSRHSSAFHRDALRCTQVVLRSDPARGAQIAAILRSRAKVFWWAADQKESLPPLHPCHVGLTFR